MFVVKKDNAQVVVRDKNQLAAFLSNGWVEVVKPATSSSVEEVVTKDDTSKGAAKERRRRTEKSTH